MPTITRQVRRVLAKFLAKEFRAARRRWQQALPHKWPHLLITVISLYGLVHWAFAQGPLFGVSFVIAASLAILRGFISTHPFHLFFVAIAVVISTLVIPDLRGDAWSAFRQGDVSAALIILAVIILLWLSKRQMEAGEWPSAMARRTRIPR